METVYYNVDEISFRYDHHREAVKKLVTLFENNDQVIALVFGGSVAKKMERPDSDIDGMVIVTEEYFEERKSRNRTAECIFACDYPGGYFDVKYMTKGFIMDAANKASEPTRNSFIGSKVLFTRDPDIPEIICRIPVFQEQETEDKMLSFYSSLCLNYRYFWKCCHPEGYMKIRVAAEVVYCLYRMVLQENKILFPCNRRLEEYVMKAPEKPEHLVEDCRMFCETMEEQYIERAITSWKEWTKYDYQTAEPAAESRYCEDYEQWWRVPRPLVNEW
ncbi:MAG: nucleotidyltransferase domain-containing protein [Fusicatenibacter sp.]|nr:nucleotidyltransferase domain-containing protein [Fusicatenibacter sp.]